MIRSGWSCLGRQLVGAVVLLLGVGTVPCATASAAVDRLSAKASLTATHLSGFATTRTTVRVGGQLWSTVTVSPRATRAITVQYRRAGTTAFKTASRANTSTLGVLTIGLKPVGTGTWQFRAVVSATSRASGVASALLSAGWHPGAPPLTKINGFATSAATVRTRTVADRRRRRHARGRSLRLRRGASSRLGGVHACVLGYVLHSWCVPGGCIARRSWVCGGTEGWHAPPLPHWRRTSPIRTVTAVDRTPPGPVTQSQAPPNHHLGFADLDQPDGRRLRRRYRPPRGRRRRPGNRRRGHFRRLPGQTREGLHQHRPGRRNRYSYAVFARDRALNYAVAAKVTVTTALTPVTARPATNVTAINHAGLDQSRVQYLHRRHDPPGRWCYAAGNPDLRHSRRRRGQAGPRSPTPDGGRHPILLRGVRLQRCVDLRCGGQVDRHD